MTLYETYRSWPDILPPNALPTFLQSGDAINVSGGLSLQTKVGSLGGAVRGTRIRYSKAAPLIGQMILTQGQKAALDTFYTLTVANGSLSSSGTLDSDRVTKIYKFTAPPRYQPVGDGHEVGPRIRDLVGSEQCVMPIFVLECMSLPVKIQGRCC
jgi:hypothetical protein